MFDNHSIIAVDCDDIIADTAQYLLDFYNLKNTKGETILITDILDYNYSKNKYFGYSNDDFIQMFIKLFEKDSSELKLPPINGALEVLQILKQKEKELHVITARQSFFEEYTKKWIEKFFPDIFTAVHFCNHEGGGEYLEKSTVCKNIGATILIEDSLNNALNAAENNIEVVFFNKPWNEHTKLHNKNIVRVEGWDELKKSL